MGGANLRRMNPAIFSTMLVTSGSALISLINFATMVLLMHQFTPGDFGKISILLTIMTVLPVLMDFGTTPSVLRFGPMLEESGLIEKKSQVYRVILRIRIQVGLIAFVLVSLSSAYLAQLLLHDAGQWLFIVLAAAGAIASSFSQYVSTLFQASERFVDMMIVRIIDAFLKIVLISGLLIVRLSVSPEWIVVIYAGAPMLALLIMIPRLDRTSIVGQIDPGMTRKIIRLSFWYMISSINIMIFMNFDLFILAILKSSEEVGFFNSGYRIASLLYLAVNAIFAVLMPRISRKLTDRDLIAFLIRASRFCLLATVMLIPMVFSGAFLFDLLNLENYKPAIPIYYLTAADHLTMVLFAPIMLLLFAVNRPKLMAGLTGIEMALNVIGDLLTVPKYGAVGAAATTLIIRFCISLLTAAIFFLDFRTRKRLLSDMTWIRKIPDTDPNESILYPPDS